MSVVAPPVPAYRTGMNTSAPKPDPVAALRGLSLPDIECRIADLEAERAALSTLRRSIIARERARKRAEDRSPRPAENGGER